MVQHLLEVFQSKECRSRRELAISLDSSSRCHCRTWIWKGWRCDDAGIVVFVSIEGYWQALGAFFITPFSEYLKSRMDNVLFLKAFEGFSFIEAYGTCYSDTDKYFVVGWKGWYIGYILKLELDLRMDFTTVLRSIYNRSRSMLAVREAT